ncbi:tetratricopeptide repeat protein [Actinospica robiniae]|uniref:tetratricopeptide repeat protein n=1 Tax=Actinospica robiniae TaxID=304901 RepID=UPI00041610F5|nr:tetratricopeptide repeat protein [Actinospica robiniae]
MSGDEVEQVRTAADEAAAAGEYARALALLGSLVAAEPAEPWAEAPWFGPQLAHLISARGVAKAVVPVFRAVGYVEDSAVRSALNPWLALVQAAAGRKDAGPEELRALSGAARRLGAAADAVAWCERAAQLDRKADPRNPSSLIMLGYALRDAGQPDRAVESWKSALKLSPSNVELHLDLADLEFKRGDAPAAQRWAARAVDLDGSSVKARGCLLAAKARTSLVDAKVSDAVALTELIGLVVKHPQVAYLRSLLGRVCEGAWWLQAVPPPTEAAATMAHFVDAPENGVVSLGRSRLTSIEAPSALAAVRSSHPKLEFEIGEVPQPDPRSPSNTGYGPPLWEYHGTTAVAAVRAPSERAVEVLYNVAGNVWGEPLVGYERALPLGALAPNDLLGLLAHVPPPTGFGDSLNEVSGLYWPRVAQAWVCLGILHHRVDEPWPQSTRRRLLLRLLHGPEDWTVDAAAFALCVQAWLRPEQRSEIAREITARYLHAAHALGRRVTALHEPLAAIMLICPAIAPDVRAEVRANLAAQQHGQAEAKGAQNRLRQRLGRLGRV